MGPTHRRAFAAVLLLACDQAARAGGSGPTPAVASSATSTSERQGPVTLKPEVDGLRAGRLELANQLDCRQIQTVPPLPAASLRRGDEHHSPNTLHIGAYVSAPVEVSASAEPQGVTVRIISNGPRANRVYCTLTLLMHETGPRTPVRVVIDEQSPLEALWR